MSSTASAARPGSPGGPGEREAAIWRSVDALLDGAEVAGVLANKVGALAARRLREQGRPVPPEFEKDARFARAAWMGAVPLLTRIRADADGPLLLIKGPEVAALYPDRARPFMDIDLLCADPEGVHLALREAGFIEVDDPELYIGEEHHLRPVRWPAIWLQVEIHLRPLWPPGLAVPPIEEIVAAAVPSATGIPGISAPDPAHHALILAAHHWATQPLHTLRDLIDVAAVAARAPEGGVQTVARAWGIERIWRTTYGAADGLLGPRPRTTAAVRVWARHLPAVQERSVLSNHLGRWLNNFWGLPLPAALRGVAAALRQELLPYPGETWREKLIRVRHAITRPRAGMSSHADAWRDEADRRP